MSHKLQFVIEIIAEFIFHLIGGWIRWVISGRKIPFEDFLEEKSIMSLDGAIGIVVLVLIVYGIYRATL
ncbi:MAG: hypothetical protein JNM93_13085 [Bacteriovoracaceae bacterium]|nr:hypothetical protein [Bacteriovoracaceae bacterium]